MALRQGDKVIYPELSYRITGLLFEVHNVYGRWRSEKTYADAFEELLRRDGIPHEREVRLPGVADGQPSRDIVDFLIADKVVVELKAKPQTNREDYAQVKRYLAARSIRLGILVNFRREHLVPKRILHKLDS